MNGNLNAILAEFEEPRSTAEALLRHQDLSDIVHAGLSLKALWLVKAVVYGKITDILATVESIQKYKGVSISIIGSKEDLLSEPVLEKARKRLSEAKNPQSSTDFNFDLTEEEKRLESILVNGRPASNVADWESVVGFLEFEMTCMKLLDLGCTKDEIFEIGSVTPRPEFIHILQMASKLEKAVQFSSDSAVIERLKKTIDNDNDNSIDSLQVQYRGKTRKLQKTEAELVYKNYSPRSTDGLMMLL